MTPTIEANRLTVRAGTKALLENVTFSASAGEVVSVVGPNGAGKSTLLRALSGEIRASQGTVRLAGLEPRSCSARELAQRRAILSQNVAVAFPFLVAEVVRMGALGQGGPAVDKIVDEALGAVDLDGLHSRVIGTLSGGEQQRVHFARVMVQLACGEEAHGPGILLLDEPTASLDLRHQLDIAVATRNFASQGTTVMVILHDLNLATRFADRMIVLDVGKVAADGRHDQTITDCVMQRVFGVTDALNQVPDNNRPFVLPHGARRVSAH